MMDITTRIKNLLKKEKDQSTIIMRSEVEVKNGDNHFTVKHNHFVEQGLLYLVNLISNRGKGSGSCVQGVNSGYYTMRLGNDTVTTTDASMTALVNEDTTEPDSLAGLNSNPSLGVYRITITATWLAGNVSGTVGELGLRWGLFNTLRSFGWTLTTSGVKLLMSRLSHADGDFTSFVINEAAPLTIEWRVTFTFA